MASKTSIVVQNTLPGVLQVTLTPLTVTKLEILTCAYEGWSDPDPADTEATVVWSWWRALEDGTEEQLVGAGEAELAASVLTAGDQVRCRVTPMNGEDAGEPKDSELALAPAEKPTMGSKTRKLSMNWISMMKIVSGARWGTTT